MELPLNACVQIPVGFLGTTDKPIPLVGFGTAEYPFGSSKDVKQSILSAIKAGYKHFDTAAIYMSEQPLGEAIAEAIHLGLIKSRHELFITSKLSPSDAHPHLVLPALHKTLKNLDLQYLDLYLIHSPISVKPGENTLPYKENVLPLDMENVWRAMEGCQKLGLTLSIGVSNFTVKKLDRLLATAEIVPAVNQVELNPYWQQKKLKKFCEEKGIHITAYAPLGAKGTPWGTNRVLESDILKEIAKSRGKTIAQICIRWVYEQGVSVLVKSFNEERMKENLGIFDWELSAEDLHKIDQLPQIRGTLFENLVSENGPYKSLVELWDGEL